MIHKYFFDHQEDYSSLLQVIPSLRNYTPGPVPVTRQSGNVGMFSRRSSGSWTKNLIAVSPDQNIRYSGYPSSCANRLSTDDVRSLPYFHKNCHRRGSSWNVDTLWFLTMTLCRTCTFLGSQDFEAARSPLSINTGNILPWGNSERRWIAIARR